jgi:hypothetical protein
MKYSSHWDTATRPYAHGIAALYDRIRARFNPRVMNGGQNRQTAIYDRGAAAPPIISEGRPYEKSRLPGRHPMAALLYAGTSARLPA